jgi:hypothetical protein
MNLGAGWHVLCPGSPGVRELPLWGRPVQPKAALPKIRKNGVVPSSVLGKDR